MLDEWRDAEEHFDGIQYAKFEAKCCLDRFWNRDAAAFLVIQYRRHGSECRHFIPLSPPTTQTLAEIIHGFSSTVNTALEMPESPYPLRTRWGLQVGGTLWSLGPQRTRASSPRPAGQTDPTQFLEIGIVLTTWGLLGRKRYRGHCGQGCAF